MNFLGAHSTSPPATASTCSNNISSMNSNCSYQQRHREHSLDNLGDSLQAAFQEVTLLFFFESILALNSQNIHLHAYQHFIEYEIEQSDVNAARRKY